MNASTKKLKIICKKYICVERDVKGIYIYKYEVKFYVWMVETLILFSKIGNKLL